MTLKVISSTQILFQGEVSLVSLPGTQGAFTVLRNHASLISTLSAGEIRYVDTENAEHRFDINGGIADIDNNIVSVCIY